MRLSNSEKPTKTPLCKSAQLYTSSEQAEYLSFPCLQTLFVRKIIIVLPREFPTEQYTELARNYCYEQFISKGMCCDFAVHDKGDGNPHTHIMLTLRAIDENGKWLPKCRKVYDLDEHVNRIGSHREDTVVWNKKENAEIWRNAWEEKANEYLEKNNRSERMDM